MAPPQRTTRARDLDAYVNPLVALLLGRFIGGEPLGVTVLGAAAVSLAGVALIARR